jgi:ubiquinone biosynthesis protein UbiJ
MGAARNESRRQNLAGVEQARMAEADRILCRRAAAECIALARLTADIETKETLLTRAQEWLKLAYSDHDEEFGRLLGEFNAQQMGRDHTFAAAPVQRQPMQQQQSKSRPPQR